MKPLADVDFVNWRIVGFLRKDCRDQCREFENTHLSVGVVVFVDLKLADPTIKKLAPQPEKICEGGRGCEREGCGTLVTG